VVLAAPYFATAVLATELLLLARGSGDEELSAIAAGRLTATAALGPTDMVATKHAGGWRLTGMVAPVISGGVADLLLCPARTGEGISVFAFEASAPGHRVTSLQGLDLTRRTTRHDLRDTPARLLIDHDAAPAALEQVTRVAAVALAAELSGVARAALDMSVGYAKERYQYGRAIGSFQAVKHRLVDMLVGADSIRTAAVYAAWTAANAPAELASAAPLAFSVAAGEGVTVTGSAIQVHGGIGMTWEHPLHLYFRRAKAAELTLGSVAEHRERLARLLWLP
jgi:alkylation response protein AidB-like acyl-CoA dehydrogenase